MYRGRGRSVSNRLPDPGRSRYTRFAGLLSLGISCQRRSDHPDIRRRISSVQLRRFYCLSSDMEVPLATVRHSVQHRPPFCVENGAGGSPARGRNPRGYNRSWKRRLPDRESHSGGRRFDPDQLHHLNRRPGKRLAIRAFFFPVSETNRECALSARRLARGAHLLLVEVAKSPPNTLTEPGIHHGFGPRID